MYSIKGSSIQNFFIKNISIAFLANLVGLLGSMLIVFILPKFIGVLQYSYYQLYLFYAAYIGFCGIGVIDGIQLRYGGKYYDKLNKPLVFAEFKIFTILQILFSLFIILLTLIYVHDKQKCIVYIAIALCIIIYIPRALFHNILQATGRINEYSITIIIERVIHLSVTTLGIILGQCSFVWFIISEIFGRFVGSLYVYFVCRDLFTSIKINKSLVYKDIKANIICGLFLMFSNIASMLIVGVIRQYIEIFWDVATFGKISLTLSVSNFILVFINSVALVLFPFLRRCTKENLLDIYNHIRVLISCVMLFLFIFAAPIKSIFSFWLPQYADSLKYIMILFPMCLYECKMSLLISTYMKTLRLEKFLLFTNLVCVILSVFFGYVTCKILHSLPLTILLIVLLLALRCIIAEFILKRKLDIRISKYTILELVLTIVFISASWFFDSMIATFVYLVFYFIYLIFVKESFIIICKRFVK